jgi:MFS family permease
MGGIIDRFGTRIGYTLSIGIWSIFGMLHAAVRPVFSWVVFAMARFGLGFGESGNFPAAVKTVAEWFPKKDRAFANGIFNAGSNVGAILAPLIIPLIVSSTGKNWQFAFLTTGIFSAIWVILWLRIYRRPEEHKKVSKEELQYITSDSRVESTDRLPWRKVFFVRQTWAFPIFKLTDAVWWFYLFWAGKFFFDMFGLDIHAIALPLITMYLFADGGSIAGGWFSSYLIRKGWTINRARKTTLLLCALIILPVMFVTRIRTGFEITPEKLEKLESAEVKVNRELVQVPQPVIDDVAKFEGRQYRAARDFEEELAEVHGSTLLNNYWDIIEGSSRTETGTFMVRDETVNALKASGIPENMLFSFQRINSKKTEQKEKASKDEFRKFIEKEVGRTVIQTYESAIFHTMRTNNLYWIAILLIALAAGGHQAWAANIFTVVSDVFPKKATASVIGIGGMVGAIAGIVADSILGSLLESSGPSGYFFAFLGAGLIYLITLGIVHILMPNMKPLGDDLKPIAND